MTYTIHVSAIYTTMEEHVRFIAVLMVMGFLLACCDPHNSYVGSECDNKNLSGVCIPYSKCPSAVEAVKTTKSHNYLRCGFEKNAEIICCPLSDIIATNKERSATDLIRKSEKQCNEYLKNLSTKLSFHVLGGEDAKLGEFPHMAALGYYIKEEKLYSFRCGGTLISNRYLLTAAHCIIQSNEVKIARLGVVDVPDSVKEPDWSIDYKISDIMVHDKYNGSQKLNDIALVKLEKKINFNNITRPACLYTKEDDPKVMIVTGWGVIKFDGPRSPKLQKATLNPLSLEECNTIYTTRISKSVTSKQLCAADDTSDACAGDSGGPLQILRNTNAYSVVGITSYGLGCGSRYGTVYTRVSSYLDWIEKIVWP